MKHYLLSIKLALRSLRVYGVRTILTTVGVIIGVATVVAVLSVGAGVEEMISGQLESFGGKTIFTEIKVPVKGSMGMELAQGVQITTLKERDMEAVETLPNIGKTYGVVMGQEKISHLNVSFTTQVMGTQPSYVDIDDAKLELGRFFNEKEDRGMNKVVVLGHEVNERLFGSENPLGKSVRMHGDNYKVLGVVEERGVVFFQNMDKYVFVPMRTAQKHMLGIDYMLYFVAEVLDESIVESTAEQMRVLLRKNHRIPPNDPDKDDFRVTTMEEAMDVLLQVTQGVSIVLLLVGLVSLLVGGVGIMNTMYVSVVERTREIGLRKALGAAPRQILLQFVSEAVIITLIGGVLGIALGSMLSVTVGFVASLLGFGWATFVTPLSLVIALGMSLIFGVVFGWYPARKASKMHPVDALRFDG